MYINPASAQHTLLHFLAQHIGYTIAIGIACMLHAYVACSRVGVDLHGYLPHTC